MQQPDPSRSSLTCFIIGPIGNRHGEFGSPERETYEQSLRVMAEVIEPACKHHGLEPVRADGLSRAGEITEQVFRRLRDDDIVIADLTGANANVMYELGLRHTRDKLTIQIGEYGRLPFDVNTIRTIQFSSSGIGLINARDELISLLEAALSGAYDPVTATRIWNESAESGTRTSEEPSQPLPSAPVGEDTDAEDHGPIDILAEAEEKQDLLPAALEAVGRCVEELGALADTSTKAIEESDAAGKGMRGRLQVILRHAAGLSDIADRLDASVDEYESVLRSVSAGNLVRIESMEQDPEDLEAGHQFGMLMRQIAASSRENLVSLASMVEAIEDNARLSRALRAPTRKVTAAFDRFANANANIDEWDRRLQSLGVPIPPEDWEPGVADDPSPPDPSGLDEPGPADQAPRSDDEPDGLDDSESG